MKRKKVTQESADTAIRFPLPTPKRVRYEIELPDNSEIIIKSPIMREVCANRIDQGTYRIWTRKVALLRKKMSPRAKEILARLTRDR